MEKKLMSLPVQKYKFIENDTFDIARVEIQVLHEKENPNGSYFEYSSFESSKESFKNKPIIGKLEYDDDGELVDFMEHEEQQDVFGVIPEETNNFTVKEIDGLNWVIIEGLIFKEYCEDAYELIKEGRKISMEIAVDDYFKGDDGFIHITKFTLLGITCLGVDYAPAMGNNATIETFFKNINQESFVATFSSLINRANELAKGGNKVKREDIIAKFSTIKEAEDYQAIVDNTSLTEEELEKQLFALSNSQIESSIRETFESEKIIKTYWDGEAYETSKYWVEDIILSENMVIAYSREDYKTYGVPFIMNGDKAELDFKSCKRYVRGDWREYSEGQTEPTNLVFSMESEMSKFAEEQIAKVKESFKVEETEQYRAIQEELKTVKAEFITLESDKNALDTEIVDLRAYKDTKENEIKESQYNEVLNNYSELKDVEEYKKLAEKKFEYSLEGLEKELKVIGYDNKKDKKVNFSTKPNEGSQLPIETNSKDSSYSGVWSILDNINK